MSTILPMSMLKNYYLLLKRAVNFNQPTGNNLKILNDDTFLVSYPRSGNTWMRFLLGNYLYGDKFDFLSRENFIPAIAGNTNKHLLSVPRPRIIKSHSLYTNRYPKVIYLVRDPRDSMVSLFKWLVKNPNRRKNLTLSDFELFSKMFFEGDFKFGKWIDHFDGWKLNSDKIINGIIFIKYEDLQKDTAKIFKEILSFLNIEIVEGKISETITNSTFNRMKSLEHQQQVLSKEVLPITGKIGFVGSGKREWSEYITGQIKADFKENLGRHLIDLNYEQSYEW